MAQKKPDPKETRKHVCGSHEEHHHSLLGEHAAVLWKHNKITDVVIKLHNRRYRAHKAVLSCYSAYFRDILLKSLHADGIIELDEPTVTAEAFEVLLLYMYTGELKLTCQNIGDLYTAGRKFLMKDVVYQCAKILSGKTKKLVHFIYLYVTAKKLGMWEASKKAMINMQMHFEQIAGTREFLDLEHDQIGELLRADKLAVRSEVVVYLSALKWISDKYLEREKYAVEIIGCVRFPLMTLNEVLACYTPPLLPAITEMPAVREMLLIATCFVAAKTVNDEKRFAKYSCSPREYLLDREAIILWDPNIFDPERYSQYRKEVAATKIQAMYRGFSTRKKLKMQREIEANAATKIQAQFRGFAARKRFESLRLSLTTEGASVISGSSDLASPASNLTANVRFKISETSGAPPKENKKKETETSSPGKLAYSVEPDSEYDSKLPQTKETLDQPKPVSYTRDSVKSSNTVVAEDPCIHAFMQSRSNSLESLSTSIRSNALSSQLLQEPHSYKTKKLGIVDASKGFKKGVTLDKRFDTPGLKNGYSHPRSYEMPPKPVLHMIHTEPEAKESELLGSPSSSFASNSGIRTSDDRENIIVEKNIRTAAVVTMGGFNPSNLENDQLGKAIHRYVPVADEWSKIGDMRQCYHHLCILYYKDCIYCIGGCDPQVTKLGAMVPVSSCSKYNIETNLWYVVSNMSHCRMYHGAVVLNDKIYAVGGKNENDSILDSLECYDPDTDRWELLQTPLSCPKMGFGSCVYKNQLWVVGGMIQDLNGTICFIREVECYDPVENVWMKHIARLPAPRCFCALVVCNQKVYVVGGTSYGNEKGRETTVESISDVDCYDDERGEWIPSTPLPNPRHSVSAVNIGGAIFAMGGLTTYYMAALDEVLVHDEGMGYWTACSPMPMYVCGFAATAVPKRYVPIKRHQVNPSSQ